MHILFEKQHFEVCGRNAQPMSCHSNDDALGKKREDDHLLIVVPAVIKINPRISIFVVTVCL